MFVHLHWHSKFSMLDSIWQIEEIVSKAKEINSPAIALTDYYSTSGIVDFYTICNKNNIKPIVGVEMWFLFDWSKIKQQKKIWNIVFLAKNLTWYQNILKLLSKWYNTKDSEKPVCCFEDILKYKDWIIFLIGWEFSFASNMILSNDIQSLVDIWSIFLENINKEDIIWEIIVQDYKINNQIKKINDNIILICNKFWNLITLDNNFHYINIEDRELFETALNIKNNNKIYDSDRIKLNLDYHIADKSWIYDTMISNWFDETSILQFISNNLKISEITNVVIPLEQKLFPNYISDEEISKKYYKNKENLVIYID